MPHREHQLLELTLGDRPSAWTDLGFEVATDHDGLHVVVLGNTSLVLGAERAGFGGWSIEGGTPDIDGLPPSEHRVAARPAPSHPNGIASIDHVVVITGDVDRTATELESAGIECSGERTTESYGAPMRQQFFWLGDVILELVGPGLGEPTSGDPAAMFGLALVSPDLDRTAAHLGDLAGTPKDAVQPGRQIAGIRGERTGASIPLAVMSPHPPT